MDSVVDRKLPNDLDSASISSKVIGHNFSNGSIGDLYLRCIMIFATDNVQTQIKQVMDLGLSTINTLDESICLSTPATRIRRPTDGSHWIAPDHVFGEAIAVGTSEAKSDHDYNYKLSFKLVKITRSLSDKTF